MNPPSILSGPGGEPDSIGPLARALGERHRAVTGDPSAQLPPANALAAVNLLVRRRGGRPEFVLIRRTERREDPWSGQMALPGGRRDPRDPDPAATAVREMWEEVGIGPRALLDPPLYLSSMAPANRPKWSVAIFLDFLKDGESGELRPDPGEVAECFWARFDELVAGHDEIPLRGGLLVAPSFRVAGHVVWGFTQRVLSTFLHDYGDLLTPAGRGGSDDMGRIP